MRHAAVQTTFFLFLFFIFCHPVTAQNTAEKAQHKAPAPLYRDPVTDGAADPIVIWNRAEKAWWMLYSQRRANADAADVAYCYGSDIGVASTPDGGKTWVYRGTLDLAFERGRNTFWAPDVVWHNGEYHMFVVYIQGVRSHWGGKARLAHYTSSNLWDWKFREMLKLTSENVIDASLMQLPNGTWRMWYKDEQQGAKTMMAESKDLYNWTLNRTPAIGGQAHEGPKAFRFDGWYWMLTDEWSGMRVYKSKDTDNWERQGKILDGPSSRKEDRPSGAHGDVVVVGNKAYVFYFTHPDRKSHGEAPLDSSGVIPFHLRRSSIQVAELLVENGTLVAKRDEPFEFFLPPQEGKTAMKKEQE